MSSSSNIIELPPEEVPDFIYTTLFFNSVTVASLAWYFYDYILTIPLEISYIWGSKLSMTAILFLINRYSFLVYWSFQTVIGLTIVEDTRLCQVLYALLKVGNLFSIIAISGIFILRIYAICGQSRLILAFLVPFLIARVGLSITTTVQLVQQAFILAIPGFNESLLCFSQSSMKFTSAEAILTVAFDVTIFVLTVSRTWALSRQAKSAGIQASLSGLLLRDGSLYVGLLSITVLIEVVTELDLNVPVTVSYLAILSAPLEAILTSRLVLNLRSHDKTGEDSEQSSKTDMFFRAAYGGAVRARDGGEIPMRPSFMDTFLGNIGEPLRVRGFELGGTDVGVVGGEGFEDSNGQDGVMATMGSELRSNAGIEGGEDVQVSVGVGARTSDHCSEEEDRPVRSDVSPIV